MYDVGRVCLKIAGREAGRYCVIVNRIDEKFVMVTGPKEVTHVKRRRCNISHLEPLGEVIRIRNDAPDEDVERAFEAGSIYTKLSIEKPSIRVKPKAEKAEAKKEERIKAGKPREKPKKEERAKGGEAGKKGGKAKPKEEGKKPAKKQGKPAAKARKKK